MEVVGVVCHLEKAVEKLECRRQLFSNSKVKMPFEEITHVKINQYGKNKGEPIAAGSVKIYKSLLNRLAEADFDTKEKLAQHPKQVIYLIENVVDGDDSKARAEKRQYYSAVFYALDQYHADLKKDYADAFNKAKDNYVPPK
jgi:hypothetical protein